MIRILLCSILLWSCGANYQLRKADRALERAKELGADVKKDTIWNTIKFVAPSQHFETTLTNPNWSDTLILKGKDSISVKILRIPATHTKPEIVYVAADYPEREVEKKVPVGVSTSISAGYSLWDIIICAIAFAVIGYIIRVVHVMIKIK